MIALPHLMILQYIKRQMRFVRANPHYIEHALTGYSINEDVRNTFGAKRIDGGIKWLQQNEFNYTPLYNLDLAKFPNICVSCESVDEDTKFLGDFGGFDTGVVNTPIKTYRANFTLKGVTDERTFAEKTSDPVTPQYGFPVVPAALNITDYIWRGLTLTNGVIKLKIKDFHLASNGLDTVIVTEPTLPSTMTIGKWSVISTNNTQGYELLSSTDKTRVKVELGISSDPETAEMIACVLKYILKSGRLWFDHNKFINVVFSQSPLMVFPGNPDNPTWSVQFTLTGTTLDMWYGIPLQKLDFVDIHVEPEEGENNSSNEIGVSVQFDTK